MRFGDTVEGKEKQRKMGQEWLCEDPTKAFILNILRAEKSLG